jgi:MFS family permease
MVAVLPMHRDGQFRRLWAVGMLGSLIRWLEILAFGVFTYELTQSAFWVASLMMLRMLPLALFGLVFGALAARFSRRSGLLVGHGLLFGTALILLAISSFGAIEVWHLATASFINGSVWAGDMPLRRSLMGDIASPPRMAQAMSLDALAVNGCKLAGPGLGGLLLAFGGLPAVFLGVATLYALALAALAGLTDRPSAHPPTKPAFGSFLVGGFLAARESPRLLATLWLTILFNLFAWPVLSMVPVIGQERLQLSTQAIGLLASMDGVGSLIGAIVLMSLVGRLRHGHVYVASVFCFLAMQLVFAWSAHPILTGAALLALGFCQSCFAVMQSTLVFVTAPPNRRYEAMGLLTMCIGVSPLGFLAVGWLAEQLGAPLAALVCALCGITSAALSWPLWRACLVQTAGTETTA